ncbi:MAG: hypothetical protein L0H24_14270, partial [Microlunatus sp.]|nr:hypothetical protein [Microlunatus sp.]
MFDQGRLEGSGPGGGRTPGQLLADRIAARDRRIRAEEVGTVLDLKEWLDLHSVDEANPFATGPAGGAGKRSGSAGTPWVDEFAVAEYAPLRHWPDPTARAFLIDVADLEHRFPSLWTACTVDQSVPVWQARQIVKACRDLSQAAAAKVDAEIAAKLPRLSWGRALSVLAAAIMTADPVLAETKRREAKQARFVQLCRSEGGIRTMIVRAEDGDLIMVYALVDRLADILRLDGSAETADQRRATAFGLLAQPAMVLQMLIRHAADGPAATGPGGTGIGSADPATAHRDRPDAEQPARPGDDPDPEADPASADDHEAEAAKPHPTGQPDTDQPDADQPDTDRPDTDQPDTDQSGSARRWPSEPGDDPDTGTSRGG